jgi:hypothetical protein
MRAATALLLLALPAGAYIEALTSLDGVVKESDVMVRATVSAVSAEKKVLVLAVGKAIRGKCAQEKIRIDLSSGKEWQPDLVLKHATVGTPVTVFYKKAEGAEHAALALVYLNRMFLSAQGGEEVWRLSQVETGMSKVFLGTPTELGDLLLKVVSGRTKAPAPDAKRKAWTKEALEALAPPPKDGDAWPAFDPAQALPQ